MLSMTVRTMIVAASVAFAAPAFAQGAAAPELQSANMAIDAATTAGVAETFASGEPYTAFVPTNDALGKVQDAATQLMGDKAALGTMIQGYVITGAVPASAAMTLVTDGGGTATVNSLAGTPITLAMDGDTLTVNGAPVITPDLAIGNVVVHVIDGTFVPKS